MATLTIFSNYYINDEERFLRLQDSFHSFKDIKAEKWVINARGEFKHKTLEFLKDNLGDKLIPSTLESKKGWFYDSKKILAHIDTDYVLFWIEDHVSLVEVGTYDKILNEMMDSKSDYLGYSWWDFGKTREPFSDFDIAEHGNISTFVLDRYTGAYIVSMQGIFSLKLFKKLIYKSMFLRNYTKFLPFSFEKRPDDLQWLPIRYALPKYELFASIDANITAPGYCLQDRGLYPKREVREEMQHLTSTNITNNKRVRSGIKKLIPEYVLDKLGRYYYYQRKYKRYFNLILKGQ